MKKVEIVKNANEDPIVKWQKEGDWFGDVVDCNLPYIRQVLRKTPKSSELPESQFKKFREQLELYRYKTEELTDKLNETKEAKELLQLREEMNNYIDRVWETKSV